MSDNGWVYMLTPKDEDTEGDGYDMPDDDDVDEVEDDEEPDYGDEDDEDYVDDIPF